MVNHSVNDFICYSEMYRLCRCSSPVYNWTEFIFFFRVILIVSPSWDRPSWKTIQLLLSWPLGWSKTKSLNIYSDLIFTSRCVKTFNCKSYRLVSWVFWHILKLNFISRSFFKSILIDYLRCLFLLKWLAGDKVWLLFCRSSNRARLF